MSTLIVICHAFARVVATEALQECVVIMATLQHTTARTTRRITHMHTNIDSLHTNLSNAPQKQSRTSRSMEESGDGVVRGARVQVPDRQAAQATGSVLPAQPSLRRAGLRGPKMARPNRRAGARQLTMSLSPSNTHVKIATHTCIYMN